MDTMRVAAQLRKKAPKEVKTAALAVFPTRSSKMPLIIVIRPPVKKQGPLGVVRIKLKWKNNPSTRTLVQLHANPLG